MMGCVGDAVGGSTFHHWWCNRAAIRRCRSCPRSGCRRTRAGGSVSLSELRADQINGQARERVRRRAVLWTAHAPGSRCRGRAHDDVMLDGSRQHVAPGDRQS